MGSALCKWGAVVVQLSLPPLVSSAGQYLESPMRWAFKHTCKIILIILKREDPPTGDNVMALLGSWKGSCVYRFLSSDSEYDATSYFKLLGPDFPAIIDCPPMSQNTPLLCMFPLAVQNKPFLLLSEGFIKVQERN